MRSFTDPDTEFVLEKSDTPASVDGVNLGEPTGEVICAECGQSAGAPEYINHKPNCSQSDVYSEYYLELHDPVHVLGHNVSLE
jgi:hypothetical protein